jgi:preprotein translocase subunit SecY
MTTDMFGERNLFAAITGGDIGTVFAMGIGPYITASIIMQLLTVAIPYLENLKKEGQEGRKKIAQFTRVGAVFLAIFQGSGEVYNLSQWGAFHETHQNMFVYLTALITMVTGTMFIMWIAELLTEKAVGNGASFIIFANIITGVPGAIIWFFNMMRFGMGVNEFGGMEWWFNPIIDRIGIVLILAVFLGLIVYTCLIQGGERKIPVQYAKKMVGRQMFGGQTSHIPIKVNIAGVMSIIFSMSLLGFPMNIYSIWQNPTLHTITQYLHFSHPVGASLYVFLIFCFTFFYTSFAVNPNEMSDNLKKNGGTIPGIRQGQPTAEFIQKTVDRMSWIGAVFYSTLAMIPIVMEWVFRIQVGFGGTTMLIVVGVALELMNQLKSQLLDRNYKKILK